MPNEFVEELFEGADSGYVYSPVSENKRWKQHFFKWPSEKDKLLAHIADHENREVYISPIIFSRPRVAPNTFVGTNVVWCEFDGNVPEKFHLEPTIRVETSIPGHEHWYWKLDKFTTDVDAVTDATKRLTYHLGADISGWDYAQVLRPPATINHKRGGKPVSLVLHNGGKYSLNEFKELPEAPRSIDIEVDTKKLPSINRILANYKWSEDTYDLFTKTVQPKQGKEGRSGALARLAFDCAEMGMGNEEILAILEDADRRWKKFTGRTDRMHQLIGIIKYVRSKKAVQSEIVDSPVVYRFNDFMQTEVKLDWVIPGILPVAGAGIIFGPAEVGKSTWALRMGMAIAAGEKQFLNWPVTRQQKVLFLSLEMPSDELKHFFHDMKIPPETAIALQDNFFIWPVGHAYPLDVREYQEEILHYIDLHGIELLIIDSLGVSMYGSISSDDDAKRLYSFLNEDLRKNRSCGYFFVHHPRKPQSAEIKKPQDYYDMFGSIYHTNNAQVVINLNPISNNVLKVNIFKSRLSQEKRNFQVIRHNDRSYEVADKAKQRVQQKKEKEDEPDLYGFGGKK